VKQEYGSIFLIHQKYSIKYDGIYYKIRKKKEKEIDKKKMFSLKCYGK
jgi:hypothetical protein